MKSLKSLNVEEISIENLKEIEGGRMLPIGPPFLFPALRKIWSLLTN